MSSAWDFMVRMVNNTLFCVLGPYSKLGCFKNGVKIVDSLSPELSENVTRTKNHAFDPGFTSQLAPRHRSACLRILDTIQSSDRLHTIYDFERYDNIVFVDEGKPIHILTNPTPKDRSYDTSHMLIDIRRTEMEFCKYSTLKAAPYIFMVLLAAFAGVGGARVFLKR